MSQKIVKLRSVAHIKTNIQEKIVPDNTGKVSHPNIAIQILIDQLKYTEEAVDDLKESVDRYNNYKKECQQLKLALKKLGYKA